MNGGFEANPEGLIAKGQAVKTIYDGYEAQKSNVYRTANEVTSAWSGADSAGYVSAIQSYEGDFRQLGVVISQIADILESHGRRLANSRDSIKAAAARL